MTKRLEIETMNYYMILDSGREKYDPTTKYSRRFLVSRVYA